MFSKKFVFFAFISAVSMSLGAWENQDWLIRDNWFVEMDLNSPNHYDWHGYKTPYVTIRKFSIPTGSTLYSRRLRMDQFEYFYQTGKDRFFQFGWDSDHDGKDDELKLFEREDHSFIFLEDAKGFPAASGKRVGGPVVEGYPLIGIWGEGGSLSEFRLAEKAEYVYWLEINKEIPSFAVREGTYVLKQTGDTVFESDSSFPDGHIRFEIKSRDRILITPLFTLPDEKGLVEPFYLRRMPD